MIAYDPIEMYQWNGQPNDSAKNPAWFRAGIEAGTINRYGTFRPGVPDVLILEIKQGRKTLYAQPGDYIARRSDGTLEIYTPAQFREQFTKIEARP